MRTLSSSHTYQRVDHALTAFAVVCVCFLLAAPVTVDGAFVLDYTVTASDVAASDWGAYQPNICVRGRRLREASESDDGTYFDSIYTTSPFFDDNRTRWYVSPNGFLSATTYPMCPFFCGDQTMRTLYGTYKMTASRGSDWPLLALFVADLDPSISSSPAGVCAWENDQRTFAVVEYNQIPLSGATRADDVLTAQVVVYANGTFIFRYKQLPASMIEMPSANLPIAGISATASRFVASPVAIRTGLALRFEPTFDTCAESPRTDSSASCAVGGACTWCEATGACMHSSLASFRCPSGTFTAGTSTAASRYSVKVDYNAAMASGWNESGVSVLPGYYVEIGFQDFAFPFFSRQAPAQQTIFFDGPATFLMNDWRVGCNPILATCVNGNYTNAILTYQTASQSRVHLQVFDLPSRPPGSTLCPATEAADCPPGVLFHVRDIIGYGSAVGSAPIRRRSVEAQLFLDEAGTIDIVVRDSYAQNTSERLFTYPPALVGIVRNGASDPESLLIPTALIRDGLHVRYTLRQAACPDCGRHGRCDGTTGTCVCDTGFEGVACDECTDATRYGADCTEVCPICAAGYCDAGTRGSGVCVCPEGVGGRTCADACPVNSPTSAPACSPAGGYVQCGTCICYEGWHGGACDTPDPDPCRARSIGGCAYCAAQDGCSFCYDYTCFSPSLSGTPRGYACSYASPFPQEGICVAPPVFTHDSRSYDITLGTLLAIILVLLIVLFGVSVWLACKRRSVYDIHVVHASGGAPDLVQPRREREVRQMAFVPRTKQVQSRYLLAVPLKQISLKKLYEKQHGLDTKSKKP